MIGVYKIENKINKKSYIGVSVDIEKRIKGHLKMAETGKGEVFYIHRALKKYGKDNFEFSVLELCEPEDLFKREIYYIEKYNSYNNGYNLTRGGEGFTSVDNPKAKLKLNEVIKIRKAYKNKDYKNSRLLKEALFPDLDMNIRNFSSVFLGESYPGVMPEVFTPELKQYYKENESSSYSNPGGRHGMTKSNDREVLEIRVLYNFLKQSELVELFGHSQGALGHWLGGTRYGHIPVFHKQKFYWEISSGWNKDSLIQIFYETLVKYKKEIEPCLNRKNVIRNFKTDSFEELVKTFNENIVIREVINEEI